MTRVLTVLACVLVLALYLASLAVAYALLAALSAWERGLSQAREERLP